MVEFSVIDPYIELETPEAMMDGILELLERAGKTCYKSEQNIKDGSAEKFIGGIIKRGHESVIEHASVSYRIVGDRIMSHQLVRHRLGSFSQESQRYCDYNKKGLVVVNPGFGSIKSGEYVYNDECLVDLEEEIKPSAKVWLKGIGVAYKEYLELIDLDIKPEDARSILPNSVKTEVFATFNFRQWRHVFEERALNSHAQPQIRNLMISILQDLGDKFPIIFKDQLERL